MQASTALQQSCTRGKGNRFFLSSQHGGEGKGRGGRGEGGGGGEQAAGEEEEEEEEEEEIRTRMHPFHSNATELYSWAKAIVSFK